MLETTHIGKDWAKLDITGYADRLSAAAGETVRFYVSTSAASFQARIVRLSHDTRRFEAVDSSITGAYEGTRQELLPGSFALVSQPGETTFPADLVATFWVHSMLSQFGTERGLLTWSRATGVFVTADGHLLARHGEAEVRGPALVPHYWHRIRFWLDSRAGRIGFSVHREADAGSVQSIVCTSFSQLPLKSLRISGWFDGERMQGCFDGKIAAPKIESEQETLAAWSFAGDHSTDAVLDMSAHQRHLKLQQHPRRAVTGPRWNGKHLNFAEAPQDYDAIAFHSDDLTDAGWAPTLSWRIPDDLASDAYALHLTTADGEDHIPFIVTPRKPASLARIAVLIPTFSYLAYANEHHWWHLPNIFEQAGGTLEKVLSQGEKWAFAQRLLSCYDRHSDGSGCTHSSYLRPILNLRAGYVHPYIRGPHQLSADLVLLDWLRSISERFELLTDHDLHARGVSALHGYRALLTGSHPEYVSAQMLDALHEFVANGGNLMYLGGNGFHNVVSTYPATPHVMELRRGHSSGVHWKSAPGEAHHASTGEPGGRWRTRGTMAHRLIGVGTASVRFSTGRAYQRTPESFQSGLAWIFEGVTGEMIDSPGVVMGAPAGFEYDRMDLSLGTPASAVRLASAQFEPQFNEYTLDDSTWTGQPGANRADLLYIPGEGRGSVFSVGSIAWTGCLLAGSSEDSVGHITRNVLNRFKAGTE